LSEISSQLLRQRIRNNIMDYLHTASSFEEQRKYERNLIAAKAPGIVPVEMINGWDDEIWTDDFAWYCEPIFSEEENDAIRSFHEIWNAVADAIPEPMPWTIEDLIGTEPWNRLARAAQTALVVFNKRGRFSSEEEEHF